MHNNHIPVLLNEVQSFIPLSKKINVIDATFGGGEYSRAILNKFEIENLIAIDRDPITKIFSKDISKKYKNFKLFNGCFSEIDKIISQNITKDPYKFDVIIFDLGLSSNQLEDSNRGFSFLKDGPLDMDMGNSKEKASDVVNNYSEKELSTIFFNYGEERFSKRIAKNIIKLRKIKFINSTLELSDIIRKSLPIKNVNKLKINPATKVFQALRVYINDELKELSIALNKSIKLLRNNGKIIVVSFQSLEDRIVKDFFNHNSGKRWRSSRHYPEQADKGPITLNIITKKPIRPSEPELINNPRSRSAKLRVAEKIN